MDDNIKEALRLLGLIAMQIADEEWPEAEDSARLLVEELMVIDSVADSK